MYINWKHSVQLTTYLTDSYFCFQSRLRDQELLQAAENGDVGSLRLMFLHDRDLNIHCTDMLGRTPLQLAVANEHQEVST